MNFQKIPPVESGQQLLELAFRRAREKGKQKDLQGNWLQIIRKKETLKLDIIKDNLVSRLENILRTFPSLDDLPLFYHKLMEMTLDFPQLKKSFGAVGWTISKVRFFQKEYVSKISQEKSREKIAQFSREFYGRISSVLKQINKNLAYLEAARRTMLTYPDIKEMFTVCIYGFPNVGKTTLLNKLTGTKAEVAVYAFTTKTINAGYMKADGLTIQVLDVPGTLAREEKLNVIELQAELVRQELAQVIVFVFDLSGYGGYSLKKQEQLLQKLGKKKKVLIYVSKTDLTEPQLLAEFKHKHYSLEELRKGILGLAKGYEQKKVEEA